MSKNYLVLGDDEYIKRSEIDKIKKKFLSSGTENVNYSVHGSDDIEEAMISLGTVPFLSEQRVVFIRDIGSLPDRSMQSIFSYLENPSGSNVLVMSSGSSFKKTQHYRRLSDIVNLVAADKPDIPTIRKWIEGFFRKKGVEISAEAVKLITELKGTDTPAVKAELEKLLSFSDGRKIEASHVEELVGRSVREAVFKLVDAINARDAGWVFRILDDLYDQRKKTYEIIGYLGWYIRIMQKIKLLSSAGAAPIKIAGELGYSPGYANRLIGQSGKYPAGRINQWVSLLVAADRDIKTGRPETLVMEMLLVKLLTPSFAALPAENVPI
ncbi:MAG: DNA polymerase III subunit delta [Candidatus Omnitrophota bacterium]